MWLPCSHYLMNTNNLTRPQPNNSTLVVAPGREKVIKRSILFLHFAAKIMASLHSPIGVSPTWPFGLVSSIELPEHGWTCTDNAVYRSASPGVKVKEISVYISCDI
ncbi:hypothetical protein SAY87_000336 [Trapa incisa]|uniref:Uncharacterized protein n=1 Tax=Trapa incisa TaxID=236973 RepID=A0AAN7GGM3_9MYRT|nr:hypothetical protein SAY87_000336 [Trapa incisa]